MNFFNIDFLTLQKWLFLQYHFFEIEKAAIFATDNPLDMTSDTIQLQYYYNTYTKILFIADSKIVIIPVIIIILILRNYPLPGNIIDRKLSTNI